VLVDPKGSDASKYRGATLVTPNKKEAAQLAGMPIDSEESLRRAGEVLRRTLEAQYVLVTLSEEGMALFGRETARIAALASEVSDVTGAGDTVLATLGFAMGCGLPVVESARLANRAAAAVVVKTGCATVTLDEILCFREPSDLGSHCPLLLAADVLERIALDLRRQGKTIVFTNGCFDLLHRGHVEYLEASRACGDCLIVAINSDESVGRLKGAGRPIQAAEDRARILASLRCVDHVVIFSEDTPYELIRRLRPHILTKGADYAPAEVVGRDLVDEVRLISLVDGRSTTRTIQRIRQRAA
jgi:D-beta-D-heptose 7-phosphate kinase/D-beta-D-heptose 1-phosphate adenosyltransferase